jgi:hypothetical protein
MEVTKDEDAWVEVASAQRELEALLAKCQPGRPLLDGPMIRGMIGLVKAHLAVAQELHSAHRHTHTIPPFIRQGADGQPVQVAGGTLNIEDAIRQGLIQVVVLKNEEPPPGEAAHWTAPMEGPKP